MVKCHSKRFSCDKKKEEVRGDQEESSSTLSFTSSGWAKYIGVGFLSSIASLMSRFTAAGKTHSHEGIVAVLSRVQHTWTSHVVFLLHLCCFVKPL